MTNNPEKLVEVRQTAVKEAEDKTKDLQEYKHGELTDVIDSDSELKAFYATAYTQLNRYIDETGDQRLISKKQELEKIYKDHLADTKNYYENSEETADKYWEDLMAIMEKEERQALKHGPNLLKDLGLPSEYKLEKHKKYNNEEKEWYEYTISKDFFIYQLYFHEDGEISIYTDPGDTSRRNFFHLYKSEKTKYKKGHEFFEKKVSLNDIRNLSAFKLYTSQLETYELSGMLSSLVSTFDYLPKRSTNPELIPLINFRDEMVQFRDSMSQSFEKQKWDPTQEQYDLYIAKIKDSLKKCLRSYLDKRTKDENDEKTGKTIRYLIHKYPMFIDVALEEIKTLQELSFFNFDEDQNYLNSRVSLKRSTLTDVNPEKEKKVLNKYGLSEEQKTTLISLQTHGFITEKDIPQIVPLLKKAPFPEEIKKFILDHPSKFKDLKSIINFIKYAQGLTSNQFEKYKNFWEKPNVYQYELKPFTTAIKAFNNPDDLDLAYQLFFTCSTDSNDIKKNIARLKKIKNTKNIESNEIFKLKKDHVVYDFEPLLSVIENLDKDYLKDIHHEISYTRIIIEKFPPESLTPANFKKLNALKPFQRSGIKYISSLKLHSKEKVDLFLNTLGSIQTSAEMTYLLITAPAEEIDYEAMKKEPSSWIRYKSLPSVKGFSDTTNKNAPHKDIFSRIDQIEQQNKTPFSKEAYEVLKSMIEKSFDKQLILDTLEDLHKIKKPMQKQTIILLMTPENAKELIKTMANCTSQCDEIENWIGSGIIDNIYYIGLNFKPKISEIIPFITKLLAIKSDKDNSVNLQGYGASAAPICLTLFNKCTSLDELTKTLDLLGNPKFASRLKEILNDIAGQNFYRGNFIAAIYFLFAVAPKDLADPQKVLDGLRTFMKKAIDSKYEVETDPSYNRAATFIDQKQLMEKPDTDFTHIAFILNILQDSSPEFSTQNLYKTALQQLNSADKILQEKGAKLMIGLGTSVQDLTVEIITDIAKKGVDTKLTKYTLSDKITPEQFQFLQRPEIPKIPLSLYFSFLITTEKANKSKDQQTFESLVNKYKAIAKENIYQGKVLILSHDPNDPTHSYLFSQDSFNTNAHATFAKDIQKLSTTTLRHGVDNESVESMFSTLETTKGNLTLIIGGHGGENYISFGNQRFDMEMLFERLKNRLAQQKSGKKWKTIVLFESCHSDYNIGLINEMWQKDEKTRDYPITMLSSSNENLGSAKMANDSWTVKAQKSKESDTPLTWEEFYRDIESKNFIMAMDKFANSNNTLFLDGIELGKADKPDTSLTA